MSKISATRGAGLVALAAGLMAVLSPNWFGVAATTMAGWALVIVAALQAWELQSASGAQARLRAGLLSCAAFFLGLSLLIGPFGEGGLMRLLLGLLLLASGGAKIWIGREEMAGSINFPLFVGTGGVSIILALLLLFGLPINLGALLGTELLASGLALVLLSMQRRQA